jgi:hypothetical protein
MRIPSSIVTLKRINWFLSTITKKLIDDRPIAQRVADRGIHEMKRPHMALEQRTWKTSRVSSPGITLTC